MNTTKQKLYCYVDETGQDTQGALFVVSVAVTKEERQELRELLAKFEKATGKGKTKWVRTRKEFKIAYLEKILTQKVFRHKIFYSLKVRGLRDESDEFIRLMDAIAGLIRENEEGMKYAKKLYKVGFENKTLVNV